MSGFTAVLDACVLYPAPLRDLLLSLAVKGLYRAKWSNQIHDEWTQSLLRKRSDIDPDALCRTRTLMNKAVPDSLVVGYEHLIDSFQLRDPNDRHVLAVAVRSNADSIVTFNGRDFDEDELLRCCVFTEHPDDFISNMLEIYGPDVIATVKEMRQRLRNPPVGAAELLDRWRQMGLPQTASKIANHLSEI